MTLAKVKEQDGMTLAKVTHIQQNHDTCTYIATGSIDGVSTNITYYL